MFSNSSASPARHSAQPSVLDFSRRACLRELMDEPSSYQDIRECLRDLARVNRTTLAYRPTLDWLRRLSKGGSASRQLHIVDVGSGGGDMLRIVERWAAGRGMSVRLTGIDRNPLATRAAQEFTDSKSSIRWITGDIYALNYVSEPIDVVISSLFTHHLDDSEIAQFVAWMETVARRGWFVNDLLRSRFSHFGFRVLARAAQWHRFVQHDGPVSIRRAFQADDWTRYVETAGLPNGLVQVEKYWPGRLTISRMKTS